jgi:hypothetical protein
MSRTELQNSGPLGLIVPAIVLILVAALALTGDKAGAGPVTEDVTAQETAPEVMDGMPTAADDASHSFEVAFMTHLDTDLPEQDIFIEREPGSGEVWRVTKGDHDLNAPLFATAVETPHNPFDPSALGPHPKGASLGLTLGAWLGQQGSGTYTCADGEGQLELNFTGLVPNGVYTLWHAFIALPPPEPFTGTLDLPLGARDGSESEFRAPADGMTQVTRTFRPCLEMSDLWTTSMLVLNYHSDGRTWGGSPGPFGLGSHIPLLSMLPKAADIR